MGASMFAPQIASGAVKLKDFAVKAKSAASGLSLMKGLGKAVGLLKFAGPIAGITALGVAAFTAWKLWRNSVERTRKEQDLMFGNTKKNAEQLGIKFKNINSDLKSAKAAADLMTQAGLKSYSVTSKIGGGFTVTAKEMQKEISSMKKNAKDIIKTINELDKTWMGDGDGENGESDFGAEYEKSGQQLIAMAKNIKTQYLNSGLSVEEATKKVYALIAASERSGEAFKVINDQGFKDITNSVTGAEQAIKSYYDQLKGGAFAGGEQSGNALANTLQLLQAGSVEIENQTRKEEEKSEKNKKNNDYIAETKASYEGVSQILDKISAATEDGVLFTNTELDNLKEANPELYLLLNNTDTAASAFAKMRLQLAGINLDFKEMGPAAAESLARFEASLSDTIKNLDIFAKSNKLISQLKNSYDKNTIGVQKFAEAEKKTYEETIKRIDAKIKRINEEADARRKAIELEFEQEDAALKLKQAELEYQHAVASGNVDAANAAQNTIKSMQNEMEKQSALRAIEEDRANKEAKAQKEREKAAEKNAAAQEKVAAAQLKAVSIQEKLMKIEGFQAQYQTLLKKQAINSVLLQGAVESGNTEDIKRFTKEEKSIYGNLDELATSLTKEINTTKDKEFAKQLENAFSSTNLFTLEKGKAVAQNILRNEIGYIPSNSTSGFENATTKQRKVVDTSNVGVQTFKSLSRESSDLAVSITGGKTLRDVVDAISKQGKGYKEDSAITSINLTGQGGGQTRQAQYVRESQLKEAGVQKKDGKWNGVTFVDKDGVEYKIHYEDSNSKGNYFISPVPKTNKNMGGYIKGYSNAGLVSGPGTGTSDSIIARVSNGEYVTRASSVSDIGVGNMTLINQKGSQGLLQAAQNIVAGNAAFGKYINKYPMGGLIPYYKDGGAINNLIASRNSYSGMPPANSSSTLIDKSINVNGPLNFNFAEAPRNGRELLAQFKAAIQENNIKKGGTIIA
jgi:hypothetical protein